MHKPSNQKVLKQIADRHGISLATANEIVRVQWEFLRKLINTVNPDEQYYPMMGIKHLGKFIVTNKRQWCDVHINIPKRLKKQQEG